MKKSLFFVAAASALMLTACSSENDVLQSATQPQPVVQQAVGFDIYTPAATNVTRAGLEGTMTTGHLQRSEQYGGGFGVYSYLVEDEDNTGSATEYKTWQNIGVPSKAPNFMVNEKILWNTVNQGWYYSPLKYWPNETNNDSQTTPAQMQGQPTAPNQHLDRLTFFAYAPYVSQGTAGVPGITKITDKNGKIGAGIVEASIDYQASMDDPNKAVDLLWGVAPSGGLEYTAVNGKTVTVKEGLPLIDMTKPNVNTNMKFLFQHALARINVNAVAAIDQVGAGGTLDPNTKITIDEITLTGYFGETGELNLDNPNANVANWRNINGVTLTGSTALNNLVKKTITLRAQTASTEPLAIAEHLRFVGTHASPAAQTNRVGVTTVRQSVIEPSLSGDKTNGSNGPWVTSKTYAASELAYSETTPYYTDAACTTKATSLALGTGTGYYYTIDEKGVYTCADATGVSKKYTYPEVMNYYDVTFHKVIASEVTAGTYANYTAYVLTDTNSDGAIGNGEKLTPKADVPVAGDYVITASKLKVPYYAGSTTYYKRDANYFMVVPTNNIENISTAITTPADKQALRTVRVKIKYYITTTDGSLAGGLAQTENVIQKDVVFPSLANGKSYNLNLILGLTSVKMEAEVDDWKVINVQGDLPQNTAD